MSSPETMQEQMAFLQQRADFLAAELEKAKQQLQQQNETVADRHRKELISVLNLALVRGWDYVKHNVPATLERMEIEFIEVNQ